MNFFKKLFSSSKKTGEHKEPDFQGVFSETYFNKRYTEQNLSEDPVLLDGCLRMVKGYFIDNKLEKRIAEPVSHPVNLDMVVNEGLGFEFYCKAFNWEKSQAMMFLAYAFSDFLINTHQFRLFKDSQPEFPLRSMTLKYDKDGTILSLYPVEYSLKVLNYEATFENLYARITQQIGNLPTVNDVLSTYLNPDKEEE